MTDLERRIAEGAAELRARFADRMQATPSLADPTPQGDGPKNRHGMPKEPPGQNVLEKHEWPVLDLGETPELAAERWKLTVDGAVESPVTLRWEDLLALPQADEQADFHCVTGWSILDVGFRGVRLETLAALARPTADATHVMTYGSDGYSTNLPLWRPSSRTCSSSTRWTASRSPPSTAGRRASSSRSSGPGRARSG